MANSIMVKRYGSEKSYQRDANKQLGKGWRVANVVQEQRNIGCLRGCVLGFFSLIFKPKPMFVVTYERIPVVKPIAA